MRVASNTAHAVGLLTYRLLLNVNRKSLLQKRPKGLIYGGSRTALNCFETERHN
jgi:hypothetical protein